MQLPDGQPHRHLQGIIDHYDKRSGYNHVLASWRQTIIDGLMRLRLCGVIEPFTTVLGIPSWSWLTRAKGVIKPRIYLSNKLLVLCKINIKC